MFFVVTCVRRRHAGKGRDARTGVELVALLLAFGLDDFIFRSFSTFRNKCLFGLTWCRTIKHVFCNSYTGRNEVPSGVRATEIYGRAPVRARTLRAATSVDFDRVSLQHALLSLLTSAHPSRTKTRTDKGQAQKKRRKKSDTKR